MLNSFWTAIDGVNAVIWADTVLYVVLGVGLLFTFWTKFGQIRALTHGVQVIRGKYDDHRDPGAINHFQALSATVGLGNIAGVAIAISLGGPGAVFWMWVVGIVGMCLKMTEVTQAMLFRNVDDPANPHGGAMWVCRRGFARIHRSLAPIGLAIGAIFCVTLLVSTVTGGNMFQAWNVADISLEYFGMPKIVTGIILTLSVGVVIVGGIRRIGDVAARIVPVMCGAYILAGLYVIFVNFAEIPAVFALIFREAFSPSEASGAFVGGTAGYGFLKGMQRALFSNEAGQGSAPIAHSAARTSEPVREGIVAGLEPFVDTICVCTITALVILLSGTWNRPPALAFSGSPPEMTRSIGPALEAAWTVEPVDVVVRDEVEATNQMRADKEVFLVVAAGTNDETGGVHHRLSGTLEERHDGRFVATFAPFRSEREPRIVSDGVHLGHKGATLTAKAFDRALPGLGKWIVPATAWLFAFSTIISWGYYGEQGTSYLFGRRAVPPYRIIYCLLILVTTQLVRTEAELDTLSTFGTGVMIWANIPIMLIFGPLAMRAYRDYVARLRRGEFPSHAAPPITRVVSGDD